MKLSISFALPDDLTPSEVELVEESIKSSVAEAVQRLYEYRGERVSEDVAASTKVEKS